MREEELRLPHWYIEFKSPNEHALRSNRNMHEAFRAHFRDRFACSPDLPVQEFCSYLADFPRFGDAEAASCEGLVTECKVRDALKQVGLNKSPGLDGLSYEVYLRMSHMFVPVLTDMFNHWFTQGAIPDSITKGVITLLKKGGRNVWEDLDNYRPITLLNKELEILALVLANRLQLVISDLIGPEQNYAVKVRLIQDNLVREILEGLKDDTEAALINLDQSKTFYRMDHRFLATVLETTGFQPEFRKWISMLYHSMLYHAGGGAGKRKAFGGFRDWSDRVTLCSLFSMSSLWSPCSVGLRDVRANLALRGVPFAGCVNVKVSAYADDMTVFESRPSDILAVKKAVERYEKVTGAKINFDKSEGLWLGVWRSGVPLPMPFCWRDGPIRILRVWFRPQTGAKLVSGTG